MNDTHPLIKQEFEKRMLRKSNHERFIMGCSMFDLSKRLVISSIDKNAKGLTKKELKVAIFLRLYGNDFNERQKQKICQHLGTV